MEPEPTDDAAAPVPPRTTRRSGATGQPSVLAIAAVVLVVLGLACWAAYHFTVSDERHSYASDAAAPQTVAVTAGSTYGISVHDGVHELTRLGLAPELLRCRYTPAGSSAARTLTVTAESTDTKAVDQIATFVAPVGGRIHVGCTGLSEVFVDDADDAGFDRSGLFLVLASILLAVGLPLGLSALRRHVARNAVLARSDGPDQLPPPPSVGVAREHDQVE